jgi:hypothetical protein
MPQQKRAFARTLIMLIRRRAEGDGYVLPPRSESALDDALALDLADTDPTGAVIDALKLAEAFDTTLASPAIASIIRTHLRANRIAHTIIRERVAGRGGIDAARRFANGQGRSVAVRAPTFGAEPSGTSLPLRSFLNPVWGARAAPVRRSTRRS